MSSPTSMSSDVLLPPYLRALSTLCRYLEEQGLGYLILVGDTALEVLTGGSHQCERLEVAVVGSPQVLEIVRSRLQALQLGKSVLLLEGYRGRYWRVRVGEDWIYVEAPEELLLRLLALQDLRLAAELLLRYWNLLDWRYLQERAQVLGLTKMLEFVRREVLQLRTLVHE